MWPKNEHHIAKMMWDELRKSEEAFQRAARSQESGTLASAGGMLDPFGRHATGNPDQRGSRHQCASRPAQFHEPDHRPTTGSHESVGTCNRHQPPGRPPKISPAP